VQLDQWDLLACWDSRVTLVGMVSWEVREPWDHLVPLEPLDQLESLVKLVPLVLLGLQVQLELVDLPD
jgi:hypothetical protein